MSERPNILYIITDQHRADWLGITGHRVVKTPNIDSIAQGGTIFDRFYVANPVCMPNRACLLTGRYSSVNGVRTNGISQDPSANNLPKMLAAAGYDTALLGKAHFQHFSNMQATDSSRESEAPLAEAKLYHSQFNSRQEAPATWQPGGAGDVETPYYGFDTAKLVTGHGDRCSGHYELWLREAHPEALDKRGPEHQIAHNYSCPQAIRTALPEDSYHTAYIRDISVDYLSDPARRKAPFFACVSFPDPHHPFNPPGKYWDMYDPDDFDVPENFDAEPTCALHRWVQEQGTIRQLTMGLNSVSRREVQEAMALTAGMITMIDDAVGKVLDALRAAGLADNTIVVFNSDHGDMLGDYGMLFKGPIHHQSTIRVPMIWNDPRHDQPERIDTLGSTIDICPTLLAAAGIDPYHGIHGIDLTPALCGQDTGRKALLIEDEGSRNFCYSANPRIRTIQTDRYRMTIVVDEDDGQLFDLDDDPGETRNLFYDPEHSEIRAALVLQLLHLMGTAVDSSPRRLALG